jgi:chemotaxis protein MotB
MSDEDGRKKKTKRGGGADDWLTTYADMVTLLLTFFVLLMNPDNPIDSQRIELIMQAFQGLGPLRGGNTLSEGILAELGNDVASMPSTTRGSRLNEARKKAISEFQPEIQNRFVKIKEDERGLVISLAGDILFKRASAEVDLERSRTALQKLARFLESEELRAGRSGWRGIPIPPRPIPTALGRRIGNCLRPGRQPFSTIWSTMEPEKNASR